MSIFSRVIGNATQVKNVGKLEDELSFCLIPGERIECAYELVRDKIIFTQYRLILTDVQGIGKKVSYKHIPYSSISRMEFETNGLMDLDSEIKLYISGQTTPAYSLKFRDTATIKEVSQLLSVALLSDEVRTEL